MKVTVEKFKNLGYLYHVTIAQDGWNKRNIFLSRAEYQSLILQLTGQLAKLDQEEAK